MPARKDLKKILLIGSGPIVIGQACEFDYSGSQAVKALKEEGYRVILVNSNPATIMTDPDLADATYVEPITPEIVAKIIEKERPDAIGLAVPGMPLGSPGMDGPAYDNRQDPYDVLLIAHDGSTRIFNSYFQPKERS